MDSHNFKNQTLLNNIDIVLSGTLASGNIGAVARAMSNMGFLRLKLVNPRCRIDEKARWMATCGPEILSNAQSFKSLREALSDCSYSFGTTARGRRWRDALTPMEMASKVVSLAGKNRVALVFGPEDMGLSNEELELCNDVVSIPTARNATSLNLSHAVMIICYEIFRVAGELKESAGPEELASAGITEAMYDHMRDALLAIGFLNRQNPDYTLGMIRRILTRSHLTVPEAKLIRGMFRQLLWYVKRKSEK